jgi:hypothetical protein
MFARFSRSWQLTKQSFTVLLKNPVLMLFPCLSALATLAVFVSFLLPLFRSGAMQTTARHWQTEPLAWLTLFGFYYCCYFVQIFFNCALMASANMVLCGGKTSLRDGLGLAASRFARIALWALIAATVGWGLRMLEERAGLVGKIIISLLGMAWGILTYFMVPVVMFEDNGVFDGVRRSGDLMKKTWGVAVGKGITFTALNLLAAVIWLVSSIAVLVLIHPLVGLLWMFGYLALWMIVVSTIDGIFRVALYRYAWIGAKTEYFDPQLIESAFVPKKKRKLFF